MLTIMFARGHRSRDIEWLLRNGLNRYVSLCRRSPHGVWESKDRTVRCELRTFDVQAVNARDLAMFVETLNDFASRGATLTHIVSNADEYTLAAPESPKSCTCTLSMCSWCRELAVRRARSTDI